jgi:hypothetical protein
MEKEKKMVKLMIGPQSCLGCHLCSQFLICTSRSLTLLNGSLMIHKPVINTGLLVYVYVTSMFSSNLKTPTLVLLFEPVVVYNNEFIQG